MLLLLLTLSLFTLVSYLNFISKLISAIRLLSRTCGIKLSVSVSDFLQILMNLIWKCKRLP